MATLAPAMRGQCRSLVLVALFSVFGLPARGVDAPTGPHGFVRDANGAPIAGAEVQALAENEPLASVLTGPDGSFAFDPGLARGGLLLVRAAGYRSVERQWSIEASEPQEIVLARAGLSEAVTVTAMRGEARLADTAGRVVVIGGDDLLATAAPTLDDALRQVPGFALFRRSDSRIANPTAQGSSLRGVGASGASRTLVLLDGIPLNDGFGGWVYWSRVPRIAIDRVEALEGGASDLYGSAALGGVVQAVMRSDPAVAVETYGGSMGTAGAALYAAASRDAWRVSAAGEAFTTDGYILVPPETRGPVDTAAGSRHVGGTLSLERRMGPATAFVSAAVFGESRDNGTPLQVNDTDWQELRGGSTLATSHAGVLSLRGWFATQTYHQTFSAISSDRTSEFLTRRQRVPSESGGFGLQWSRNLGSENAFVAGLDGRLVNGRSDETPFTAAGQALPSTSAGGREAGWALFATDRIQLGSRALLSLGARLDRWSGGEDGTTAISPRVSILHRATSQLQLTASGYGAFRAPTLNERYRSFRVGNTVTLANADLEPERLWGGEAGVAWSPPDGHIQLRAVGFLSHIEDPIANVTLRATSQLITRERQNLGRNLSRGIELDIAARPASRLRTSVGYALIDASVASFPASPELEGNQVPQVPRHQLTFEARFDPSRRLELSAQGRLSSRQFEDDRNELPLAGYFTLDVQASRRLGRLSVFAALENLTGERYEVGRTPTPTFGPPRAVRVGLRFE